MVHANEIAIVFVNYAYIMPLLSLSYIFESIRLSKHFRSMAFVRISELEGEVVKVSRVAEVGYIAGNIAHDVRNPLSVIMAIAGVVKRKVQKGNLTDDSLLQHLDRVNISAKTADKIAAPI